MNAAIRALCWELTWKNRVVFPALLLLLLFGVAAAFSLSHADPDVWWASYVRGSALVAFFTSVVLGYGLFSLMESNEGWRMNSMTTRWFVLPLRTGLLVGVPLLVAFGFMALLVGAWAPWLQRIIKELDVVYMLEVFLIGIVAMQALAWTVPRRPGQFWFLAAFLFILVLYLAIMPQDMRQWNLHRSSWMRTLGPAAPLLALFALYAAHRNRRGDWPGEIPLARLAQRVRWRSIRKRDFASPATALFWSDALPRVRSFTMSWLVLSLIFIGWVYLVIKLRHLGDISFGLKIVSFAMLDLMPFLGVLWLAGYGLCAGCEPNAGFRTRLSSFRAILPVTAGTLAGWRMAALILGWSLVWLPLLGLTPFYDGDLKGMPDNQSLEATLSNLRAALAWKMALSAHVLVGALPFLLRGRLEGFPVLLLTGLSSWAWTWILAMFLNVDGNPGWRWMMVGTLLALKWGSAIVGLVWSWRTGQITWRFPASLLGGWLLVTGSLIWVLPSWQTGGAWRAAGIALLVPLGRLAFCPWAAASNRHR